VCSSDLRAQAMLTQATLETSVYGQMVPPRAAVYPRGALHSLLNPAPDPLEMAGAATAFGRNSEIYGENEPATYLYKVISGTVRTYKVLNDGRRQIGGFYVAGDTFGFESAATHSFSAEAITSAKILVIKRSTVVALAARDCAVAQQLLALTGRELARAQEHLMLLVKTRRNGLPASCSKWPTALRRMTKWSFRCRARTLPTISA